MDNSQTDLEFKYIDQRYDGLEAWIRFKESSWIRLDAFLEYYLFKNVDLTKEYKGLLGNESVAKLYYQALFDMFSVETSGGRDFDFEKYIYWQKNDKVEIGNAVRLMNL